MKEQLIHHLSVRIATWQAGRSFDRQLTEEHDRGTPDQCDDVARGHGVMERIRDLLELVRVDIHHLRCIVL